MPEAEQRFQKRQTAYKLRINDILNSRYVKTEGFEPNYLDFNGKEISRINVVGIVVQKSELNNYKTLSIEDGTGKISARVFENNALLGGICISDFVLIIGRPREFSSEKYILIETIKKINHLWAKVRKLELGNQKADDNFSDENPDSKNSISAEEDVIDLAPNNRIFKLIKELDKGNGVSIEDISSRGIKDVDKIINRLLKEGDLFEIRPGKLKVLE